MNFYIQFFKYRNTRGKTCVSYHFKAFCFGFCFIDFQNPNVQSLASGLCQTSGPKWKKPKSLPSKSSVEAQCQSRSQCSISYLLRCIRRVPSNGVHVFSCLLLSYFVFQWRYWSLTGLPIVNICHKYIAPYICRTSHPIHPFCCLHLKWIFAKTSLSSLLLCAMIEVNRRGFLLHIYR